MKLPHTDVNEWRWRWQQHEHEAPHYPLHRIATIEQGGSHDACADGFPWVGCVGAAVCGLQGDFAMPGMFSRMGAPRCPECCKRLGIPEGEGAPFNDDELKDEPTEFEAIQEKVL